MVIIDARGDLIFQPTADLIIGKSLGKCPSCSTDPGSSGPVSVADPIELGTGNMFEEVEDYTTVGPNPLTFVRYYNSQANTQSTPFASLFGVNWRSNYDRYIKLISSTLVYAERPDGRILTFSYNSSTGNWVSDTDVDMRLTNSGSTWTLKDHQDVTEVYTAISSSEAQLNTIATSAGYVQTLNYTGAVLNSVSDSYSRTLSFTYTGTTLTGVTTPDPLVLSYSYDTPTGGSRLKTVGYNTTPATNITYLYENTSFPFSLTGTTDENGARYKTWSYDTQNRGIANCLGVSPCAAGSVGYTQISYDDTTGNRTVTGPLGMQETYQLYQMQGLDKVGGISRHDPSGTVPDATQNTSYDSNGYLAQVVDWNGNITNYTNDANGNPTTIAEASGSSPNVERDTQVVYDTTWVRKPSTVTVGNQRQGFTYDATTGNMLTKTLTDIGTVTGYAPTSKTWHYTYTSTGQLKIVQWPRAVVTYNQQWGYSGGVIINYGQQTGSRTNLTTFTAYRGGGLPLTTADPAGVTTVLTYDNRNHLLTSTVATAAGNRRTTYGYDAAENLTSVALPSATKLTYTYDNAHRQTKITDLLSQTKNYVLDALGNVTSMTVKDASSTTKKTSSATFDSLGRRLTSTGGASQTTHYAYDANGNVTSIIDPMNNPATVMVYDALNRASKITDRAAGITQYTYDQMDKPLTVATPNGASTSYLYDGYEEMAKQVSSDSGTAYFYYDADGNLTQKKDALNVIANYSYDGLDRRTGITYPASTSENVVYTYDESGHGKGTGRLTSMTDQAGTFSRSYDERGNITTESHTHGTYTLTNSYGYDAAGLLASITYPSGMVLTQTRDTMERITALALQATSSGTSQPILSSATYAPFGPTTGFTFGNGIAHSITLDGDYRATNVTDNNSIQNLTYALNANDNVTGITDAITSGNSQTLTYDALDRLKTAAGGYGSESFGYDANGNRNLAGTTTWSYTPNSNRLTAVGTTTVTPNANGSVTGIAYSTPMGFTYNNAGRLATATSGSGTVLSYLYDGFGQRIGKTDTIQRFEAYDWLGRYIEQTDNTDTAKLDYIYLEGMPVATFVPNASTGTLSFLHTDRLGTPRLATSSTKAIGWNATVSDPFNAPNNVSGNTIANDLRMPGQEFEISTGFNHNGWRDYAPALGRYLESDLIGLAGGVNTYAYASDNPAAYVDPMGLAATPASCSKPPRNPLTPKECQALANKINNILQQIADKQTNLNNNPGKRGYYEPATRGGGVYDHQVDLGDYIKNLAKAANEYNQGCGGGPPGPSTTHSPAPSAVPIVVPPIFLPMAGTAAEAAEGATAGEILAEVLAGLLLL
nr:RHS repeat-associated core domain-containing protein [Granulicella aggregans]